MTKTPWLWLIAGPNGAGKTTLAELGSDVPVINPDTIARALSPHAPARAALEAGRRYLAAIRANLARGESFGFETTLSGRVQLDIAADAKRHGWKIGAAFICVESPDLAVARVEARASRGGHGVPVTDIRRRYSRSLANLPRLLALADVTLLFDNSAVSGHRLIASFRGGRRKWQGADVPGWAKPFLLTRRKGRE